LPERQARAAPAAPAPGAQSNLAGVKDEGLRAALEQLAAAMATTRGPPRVG
jgi:hypothetical protein